jgi:hypothetical protein
VDLVLFKQDQGRCDRDGVEFLYTAVRQLALAPNRQIDDLLFECLVNHARQARCHEVFDNGSEAVGHLAPFSIQLAVLAAGLVLEVAHLILELTHFILEFAHFVLERAHLILELAHFILERAHLDLERAHLSAEQLELFLRAHGLQGELAHRFFERLEAWF